MKRCFLQTQVKMLPTNPSFPVFITSSSKIQKQKICHLDRRNPRSPRTSPDNAGRPKADSSSNNACQWGISEAKLCEKSWPVPAGKFILECTSIIFYHHIWYMYMLALLRVHVHSAYFVQIKIWALCPLDKKRNNTISWLRGNGMPAFNM